MTKTQNMANPPNFTPIVPAREKEYKKYWTNIKEKLKGGLFNNPERWPVYTKYLHSSNRRYRAN